MTEAVTELLKNGSRGAEVKRAQERLLELGYAPGAADGIFGPNTERAVREYQAAVGLVADGIIGAATVAKLYPRLTADFRGMQAVSRLIQHNGRGRYVLGAGGTNPNQSSPFTWIGAQYGSDCVGAVCWALGIPRSHPSFPEYEGDINCDSAMMDAGLLAGGKGDRRFFEPVDVSEVTPGCLVVYPSIRAKELWPGFTLERGFKPSDRVRIGHIGIVAGWDGLQDPFQLNNHRWSGDYSKLVTIECRSAYPAVRMGRNTSFLDRTRYSRKGETWTNQAWGVRFMKYVGP